MHVYMWGVRWQRTAVQVEYLTCCPASRLMTNLDETATVKSSDKGRDKKTKVYKKQVKKRNITWAFASTTNPDPYLEVTHNVYRTVQAYRKIVPQVYHFKYFLFSDIYTGFCIETRRREI